jgi:hypothetical protein
MHPGVIYKNSIYIYIYIYITKKIIVYTISARMWSRIARTLKLIRSFRC